MKTLERLIKDIYNGNMTIGEAEIKQNIFFEKLDIIYKPYPAKESKYIDLKESVSKDTNKFYDGWKKIVLDTPKQKGFANFLEQIREKQKYIDINIFDRYFSYRKPDEMLQDLCFSKSKIDYNEKLVLIHKSFDYIVDEATGLSPSTNKSKLVKILGIVNNILDLNEKNKRGQEIKILTPSQMLSR